jgi:hypothetical protein
MKEIDLEVVDSKRSEQGDKQVNQSAQKPIPDMSISNP